MLLTTAISIALAGALCLITWAATLWAITLAIQWVHEEDIMAQAAEAKFFQPLHEQKGRK